MSYGKIAEGLKVVHAFRPERLTGATVYYNGQATTSQSGVMIDTKGYDEALIVLGVGTMAGSGASLLNSVYESATDNPQAATLITGASFTGRNTGNDDPSTTPEGSFLIKNYKRYIALVTETQNGTQTCTVDFSAVVILGKPQTEPVSKTLEIDLDDNLDT